MDDVRWQAIPEDRRQEAEERLLNHLGKTRAFLFAAGMNDVSLQEVGCYRRG